MVKPATDHTNKNYNVSKNARVVKKVPGQFARKQKCKFFSGGLTILLQNIHFAAPQLHGTGCGNAERLDRGVDRCGVGVKTWRRVTTPQEIVAGEIWQIFTAWPNA